MFRSDTYSVQWKHGHREMLLYIRNSRSFYGYRNTLFSDASEIAYGGCVYCKFIKKTGNVKVSFVRCKSRIAPLKKKLTIRRMQLMGNLIVSISHACFKRRDEI